MQSMVKWETKASGLNFTYKGGQEAIFLLITLHNWRSRQWV